MQCSAVEEEDPVQVENNLRDARCDLFQASLELLRVRQVELARELAERNLADIGLAHLELVRRHTRQHTAVRGRRRGRLQLRRGGHHEAMLLVTATSKAPDAPAGSG